MSQYWHTVTITVPHDAIEAVQHHLFTLGSLGTVEEENRTTDSTVTLKAYFSSADYNPSQLQSLLRYALESFDSIFPQTGASPLEVAALTFNEWGENWKQYFQPFYIAPSVLVTPSWENPTPQKGDTVITLDPGMAFGTGLHPTTQLSATFLENELKRNSDTDVLDVGCGSGILSILAAKLGATKVAAVDIDSNAVTATTENATVNKVQGEIQIYSDLSEVSGTYPILVANILLSTLQELKPALLQHLAPDGSLILSGILKEQEESLLNAFESPTLRCVRKEYREEWACYLFTN